MISLDDILVVKHDNEVVICLNNGIKLIKPIDDFRDMTEKQIAEWFCEEVNTS